MNDPNRREVKQLLDRLIKISPNDDMLRRAQRMRSRHMLPMDAVIEKIPGDTIVAKAKRVGVARQTMYYWAAGYCRPSKSKARLVASLTGYDYAAIRGLDTEPE